MRLFGAKDKKSKKEEKPKKEDKPKKLPDSDMDKVGGGLGATHQSAPPPSSDGKGG